jgi:hypothetical protein
MRPRVHPCPFGRWAAFARTWASARTHPSVRADASASVRTHGRVRVDAPCLPQVTSKRML